MRSKRILIIFVVGVVAAPLLFYAFVVGSLILYRPADEGIGPIRAISVCPDGQRFVTANQDGTVRLWHIRTGKELESYGQQQSAVTAVDVSPDGQYIAATWNDWSNERFGTVIWDLNSTIEVCKLIGHAQSVNDVTFTPDNQFVISASSDKTIRQWDANTGEEVLCLRGHDADVNSVCVTPDGQTVLSAAGDYWGGELHDPTMRLWSLDDGSQIHVFEGHSGAVYDVATTPDAAIVASASRDDTIRIWDVNTGKELRTIQGSSFNTVAIDSQGRFVLSGSGYTEGSVQLWDLATGKELHTFSCTTVAHDVSFSPNGNLLISAHGYHAGRPTRIFGLTGMEGYVKDGVAIVWNVKAQKEIVRVGGPNEANE